MDVGGVLLSVLIPPTLDGVSSRPLTVCAKAPTSVQILPVSSILDFTC